MTTLLMYLFLAPGFIPALILCALYDRFFDTPHVGAEGGMGVFFITTMACSSVIYGSIVVGLVCWYAKFLTG